MMIKLSLEIKKNIFYVKVRQSRQCFPVACHSSTYHMNFDGFLHKWLQLYILYSRYKNRNDIQLRSPLDHLKIDFTISLLKMKFGQRRLDGSQTVDVEQQRFQRLVNDRHPHVNDLLCLVIATNLVQN